MTHLVNTEDIPNGSYGFHPPWRLRLATYSTGSTYVEVWSPAQSRWVCGKRVAIHGRPV